jgi:transcriptional regulator with XRE-family HTH domain
MVRTPFGLALRSLREDHGLSQNALARRALVDVSYISRLESDTIAANSRTPGRPSRQVVESLAESLDLSPDDRDALLVAADYCPDWFDERYLGHLKLIAQVAGHPTLPAAQRAAFLSVIRTCAEQWLPRPSDFERERDYHL